MKFTDIRDHLGKMGRPPHGGRGLKSKGEQGATGEQGGRPPHGGRGLKYYRCGEVNACGVSPPARGAWIEIKWVNNGPLQGASRPPHGGRGLK